MEHTNQILFSLFQKLGAQNYFEQEVLQELWSGYGTISRYGLEYLENLEDLEGNSAKSVVVKHINPPALEDSVNSNNHPRGWNTSQSHLRKLNSYKVEFAWYKNWSSLCGNFCKVPQCLGLEGMSEKWQGGEAWLILEDLKASGYHPFEMKNGDVHSALFSGLRWLAYFHGTFMHSAHSTEGPFSKSQKLWDLWEKGTYWHLDTRKKEWEALDPLLDKELKMGASTIDQILTEVPYQTMVHGDAKLANFCFSKNKREEREQAAAVDFQYVGKGCGMKDVAYFIGSCLDEEQCAKWEQPLLDYYFTELSNALKDRVNIDGVQYLGKTIESIWRPMYRVAWADFYRFLKGWSPGHWKIHRYSDQIVKTVLEEYVL